jgi:hypothetical protein
MLQGLNGISITRFHDWVLAERSAVQRTRMTPAHVWQWIEANHRYNALLWDEEDRARRTDVGDSQIAASKRLIDQYNQKRNDAVETLDEAILNELRDVAPLPDARLSSETPGAMVDRLSILALKIFHMRTQTERRDVNAEHIRMCQGKLQRLSAQRRDLCACLDRLLDEIQGGHACFKIYRQFKMYNDPTLNPYLYQRHGTAASVEHEH